MIGLPILRRRVAHRVPQRALLPPPARLDLDPALGRRLQHQTLARRVVVRRPAGRAAADVVGRAAVGKRAEEGEEIRREIALAVAVDGVPRVVRLLDAEKKGQFGRMVGADAVGPPGRRHAHVRPHVDPRGGGRRARLWRRASPPRGADRRARHLGVGQQVDLAPVRRRVGAVGAPPLGRRVVERLELRLPRGRVVER